MTAAIRLTAGLAIALAGCAQLDPDVGPLLAGTCRDADSNPATAVSFSADLRPLINRVNGGCSCHMPFGNSPGPGTQLGGLDLSSLTLLREGGFTSGRNIVIDGQPCESILFQKVSEAPPFGSRMPLGGPFLTPEEIQLFHDWIAEGARDN